MVGQQAQLRSHVQEKAPRLWNGISRVRVNLGTAIVGDPQQVIAELLAYWRQLARDLRRNNIAAAIADRLYVIDRGEILFSNIQDDTLWRVPDSGGDVGGVPGARGRPSDADARRP